MEALDVGYDDNRFTTAVHEDLHCAICLNVLKEPMQCKSNEHHFCSACIKRHLENSQTCPSCQEELSLATLKKPSRFLATNLSDLVIRCDYVDRGCPEVVVVADLKTHLVNCEFSPVQCSNLGCTEVVNKREKRHHESQTCQFREPRCDGCRETGNDNDEMKLRLGRLEDQMSQMITGMKHLTQAVNSLGPRKAALESNEDIIVVGGRNETARLSSAEMFSWSDRAWVQLPAMTEVTVIDSIFEVLLTPPYSLSLVSRLPQHVCCHSAERFDNNIYVVGGSTADGVITDQVIEYDVHTHECVNMPALPFPVYGTATVSWQNNVIVIGGQNVEGKALDTAVMYDVKSGKSKMLPRMKYRRYGCTAVVSNNMIAVMGGLDENDKSLHTVESFSFDRYCWEELPPMIEPRSFATAVVKCCNFA